MGAAGRAGIELLLAGILVLAGHSCGGGPIRMKPPGAGGGAGASVAGSAGGGSGSGGDGIGGNSGAADGGDYPPCPQPAGGPCAVENTACARSPECRQCVGGFTLVRFPAGSVCICHAGRWDCVPQITSVSIVDCFVEEPLSCQDAQSFYIDPACTEHPPCSP